MALILPRVSPVPVATSMMRADCRSVLGKAITGSEVSCFYSA
jgi:hypothetical protein